jgi:2-keto-4-pentenoate hydratase/2-oxohepta-3-ene-1,7-dioic acid hydratase in catechol pathway
MKVARIHTDAGARFAHERDGEFMDLGSGEQLPPAGRATAATGGKRLTGRVLAPVVPSKIIAVGLNYRDHITEAGLAPPNEPLLFAKLPSSVIGPGDNIEIDQGLTTRVDWEVELAVVIGREMRRVSRVAALSYVYGYTATNDVTARDLQLRDAQWTRGKGLDTFGPVGPRIVTADEIDDPQSLLLSTRVNGETVQRCSTSEMLFSVAEILSFCSRAITLLPGDLVLTGTPWGCGEFMSPPRSLQPGDTVEVEVDRIGTLRNSVVAAP